MAISLVVQKVTVIKSWAECLFLSYVGSSPTPLSVLPSNISKVHACRLHYFFYFKD